MDKEKWLALKAAIEQRLHEGKCFNTKKYSTRYKFIWIGTLDGSIGNQECHYEFCADECKPHEKNYIYVELHCEGKNHSQFHQLEELGGIHGFKWCQYGVRLNETGWDITQYEPEELAKILIEELHKLDKLVGQKAKFIMNQIKSVQPHIDLLKANHNIVLTGAPGTGKTFLAKQMAEAMDAETGFVQFHPSYDYTDFVEGLRPTKPNADGNIGFERRDGVLKAFCKKALEEPKKNFVFIIDEINRGEISKIFGELFFAIDPGYRGEKGRVMTQYQNLLEDDDVFTDGFYIPENVYIIGTMNDIDRSVESMDFAMRRRFAWCEVRAEDTASQIIGSMDSLSEEVKREAIERMKSLNKAIASMQGLGREYQIGGAYFTKLQLYGGDFQKLWDCHLRGVLREYLRGNRNEEEELKALKQAYNTSKNTVEP